ARKAEHGDDSRMRELHEREEGIRFLKLLPSDDHREATAFRVPDLRGSRSFLEEACTKGRLRSDLREGHHRGIFAMRGPERVGDPCGIIAERSEDGAREGETFFRIFRLLAGVEADVLEENNRSWLLRAEGITIPFALEINELDIQPEELSETRSDRSKRELLSI